MVAFIPAHVTISQARELLADEPMALVHFETMVQLGVIEPAGYLHGLYVFRRSDVMGCVEKAHNGLRRLLADVKGVA